MHLDKLVLWWLPLLSTSDTINVFPMVSLGCVVFRGIILCATKADVFNRTTVTCEMFRGRGIPWFGNRELTFIDTISVENSKVDPYDKKLYRFNLLKYFPQKNYYKVSPNGSVDMVHQYFLKSLLACLSNQFATGYQLLSETNKVVALITRDSHKYVHGQICASGFQSHCPLSAVQ